MGFSNMTEIQANSIPHLLQGRLVNTHVKQIRFSVRSRTFHFPRKEGPGPPGFAYEVISIPHLFQGRFVNKHVKKFQVISIPNLLQGRRSNSQE